MASEHIKLDNFEKFFNEKFKSSKCDMCGANEWAVDQVQEILTPFVPASRSALPVGPAEIDAALPVVLVYCNNCGNMKIISRVVINRWMLKNDVT